MEFNKLVKEKLYPIFKEFGFEIAEEFQNCVRFQSQNTKINLVHNNFESEQFIEVGRKNEISFPISNEMMMKLTGINYSIEHVIIDVFVKNIADFFKSFEGHKILKGELENLEVLIKQISIDYTLNVNSNQLIDKINKYWEEKKYNMFLKSLDEFGLERLPHSYELKYKIAKSKLS